MITTIFHITSWDAWKQAQREGVYRAASLDTQGFIHLSTAEQVVGTANRFYQGVPNLLLLVVDVDKLHSELRYEPPAEAPASAERFPHLYGALNLDAVLRVVDFPPDGDAGWSRLPPGANS